MLIILKRAVHFPALVVVALPAHVRLLLRVNLIQKQHNTTRIEKAGEKNRGSEEHMHGIQPFFSEHETCVWCTGVDPWAQLFQLQGIKVVQSPTAAASGGASPPPPPPPPNMCQYFFTYINLRFIFMLIKKYNNFCHIYLLISLR